MIQEDVKASCFIEHEEDTDKYLLFVNIMFGQQSMTLEYSEITTEILDFIAINENYMLYHRV